MAWRVAKSLLQLQSELDARGDRLLANGNRRHPDGFIGDLDHQKRTSDHNPWVPPPNGGVVTAGDFTHDPANGLDCHALAEHLRRSRDKRIKYVIWDGRMFSSYATSSHAAWTWRPYTGPNMHRSHLHLSVQPTGYDSTAPWGWASGTTTATEEEVVDLSCKQGDSGQLVKYWQGRLRFVGAYEGKVDGDYGPRMAKAVEQVVGGDGSTLYWFAALRIDVAVAQKAAGTTSAEGAQVELDLRTLARDVADALTVTVK